MRGCWLTLALLVFGLVGCNTTPKREMKQEQVEEFSIPPAKYDAPPDYPRDDKPFTIKQSGGPMNMGGVGQPNGPNLPGGPSSGMSAPRR